jgi:protein-disulfide isomerase
MSQGSNGSSLIAAALILGASLVAGAYMVSASMDGAALQLASLNTSIQTIAANSRPGAAAPSGAAQPAVPQILKVEVGSAPIQGAAEAKVTIIEWADFQCPYCGRVGPTLDQIMTEYGDDVRIVFKHLPLSFHDKANGAHQAAEAAHQQGQFWGMHDLIFANQRALSEANYLRYATEMGLDLKQFKADMASSKVQSQIDADLKVAQSLGVTGTPTFIINGKKLSGAQPFPAFKSMIDAELANL